MRRPLEGRARAVQEGREACAAPSMSAPCMPLAMLTADTARPHPDGAVRSPDCRVQHPKTRNGGVDGLVWPVQDHTLAAHGHRRGGRLRAGRVPGHRLLGMAALRTRGAWPGHRAPSQGLRGSCAQDEGGRAEPLVTRLHCQGHLPQRLLAGEDGRCRRRNPLVLVHPALALLQAPCHRDVPVQNVGRASPRAPLSPVRPVRRDGRAHGARRRIARIQVLGEVLGDHGEGQRHRRATGSSLPAHGLESILRHPVNHPQAPSAV